MFFNTFLPCLKTYSETLNEQFECQVIHIYIYIYITFFNLNSREYGSLLSTPYSIPKMHISPAGTKFIIARNNVPLNLQVTKSQQHLSCFINL